MAALAPAADLGPQFEGKVPAGPSSTGSAQHQAALRINTYQGMLAAYPDLHAEDVLLQPGLDALAGDKVQCIHHLTDVIQENVSNVATLFVPAAPPAAWLERLNENTAGNVASQVPAIVMQGTADTVINPNSTTQYVQRACKFGSQPIQYNMYAGATHDTVPFVAMSDYVSWIADRFAGQQAPSNC